MTCKVIKHFVSLMFVMTLVNLNIQAQTYAFGNYTGKGTAKSITGLGFSPEAIIIKSNGAHEAVFTTSYMPAGKTKQLGTGSVALITGEVTSLDSDGFTIGTGNRTNNNGTQYNWIAFNSSGNIHVDSTNGNGSGSGRTMAKCGFGSNPEAVLMVGDAAAPHGDAFFSGASHAGNIGFFTKDGSSASSASPINGYTNNGFTCGSAGTSANQNGTNYYYIAFNSSGTAIKESTYYVNQGSGDWAVTGFGATPDFALAQYPASGREGWFRLASQAANATDHSSRFTANAAATGGIKSFDAGAGFTVTNGNTQINNAWQTHSYFAMSGGTSLPVQMTSFEAVKQGDNVNLSWQTASEINSSHFDVLHSTDAVHFESLGRVDAMGNKNTWTNYDFVHENAGNGVHYYQLSQFDNDGKNEKFKILAVNINNAVNIITQLFPNPSSNNVTLYYNSVAGGTYKVNITNINGDALYFAHSPSMAGENKFRMTVEPYDAGTYFINLTDPNGTVSSVKVIKNN